VDLDGLLVLPGLVDVHQHGGGGGWYGGPVADVTEAAHFHRSHGTTTTVASLGSAGLDELETQVGTLAPLVAGGLLAGIHLEGPWLSPRRAGAHRPSALRAPVAGDIARLVDAGGGGVAMVTLAPELPGALEAVEQLTALGIVVAAGHTDATYEQTREAIRRGVTVGTHLFNAMRPVHHREPGPVVALLESGAVLELVADGVHVHPAMLAATARRLGPDRTLLVTDATAGAGMPDGSYPLGDREVVSSDGVARGAEGEIAGSTATLADDLRYAVTVAGLPLRTAIAACTSVPARLLGLDDVGVVRVGARADLAIMTPDLRPAGVLFRGRWAGEPPAGPAQPASSSARANR
jgi:N-acetylglucosamine-6-phosphate deacetylase